MQQFAVFGWHSLSAGACLSSALVSAEVPHYSVSISLSNYGLRKTAVVFHTSFGNVHPQVWPTSTSSHCFQSEKEEG